MGGEMSEQTENGTNGNGGVKIQAFGLKISLNKKAMAWVVALLTSGLGTGLTFRGPIVAWLVTPAIEAKAAQIQATIIPNERTRTDSVVGASVKPILARLQRIEEILERMPGGKQAVQRLKRDSAEAIFHR